MAQVETVDVAPVNGSETFPLKENEFIGAVETIASQRIVNAKSSNRIVDGFFEYPVENGSVIEEGMLEMLLPQAFVKMGQPDFSPKDPTFAFRYFNNWDEKQWETSTRRNEIRKILANKGVGQDDLLGKIVGNLTESEGWYDYKMMRDTIKSSNTGVDVSSTFFGGLVPKNAKGITYALREMFMSLRATNKVGNVSFDYAVDVDDIRIAISEELLNVIDITELANIFNLEKVALFGKLVIIPKDSEYNPALVCVYDRHALGRGTRLFEYSQDIIGKGLYINHYLTTDRCYFYNPLFKCIKFDFTQALTNAKGELLEVSNRSTTLNTKTKTTDPKTK